jgi:hypothetical protein
MKHLFTILLLIVIFTPGVFMPQRALALPIENFGKPIEAYAIRPGLLLSVTRYPDGQPKTMTIESALAAHTESFTLPGMLNQKVIDEVIAQLVPIEFRGKKSETPNLGLCADSCSFFLESSEQVSIILYSRISWHELDKPFGKFYKDQDEVQRLVIYWHQPRASRSN